MTIGTAIVLSAIFIGLVLLYGFTKDRVSWSRTFKRIAIALLGLAVAGCVIAAAIYYWDEYQSRPSPFTQLWGVGFGDSESDIIFRRGLPDASCSNASYPNWKSIWFVRNRDNSSETDDFSVRVTIFEASGARRILLFGDLSNSELDSNHNISSYNTSASLKERWGEPAKVIEFEDKTRREYLFPAFNLAVRLAVDRPDMIEVYDPHFKRNGLSLQDDDPSFDSTKTVCVDKDGKVEQGAW